MKILVLTEKSDRPEEALFCALPSLGFEVYAVCGQEFADKESVKAAGIKTFVHGFGGRLDMATASFVRTLVRKHGIDLIYAPRNNTLGIGVMASLGARNKVVGYRGTTHHLHWYDPSSLITYFNTRVDHIVCVSDAVKQYLLGMGLSQSKLTRIHKGHDLQWYSNMKRPSKQELRIAEGSFTLCFVGRIRPVKGCDVILDAMKLLSPEKDITLLLIGELAHPKVRDMLNSPDLKARVRQLGHRDDAPAIAGMCKVFLMPSLKREGLPRAVIEAMAQGVPPIVTNVGGLPELVEDGENGIVIEPGDHHALAKAILTFHCDEDFRSECGKAARKTIEQKFNIKNTIQEYATLFHAVCSKA